MSELQITDEGIASVWDALTREIHELVAPRAPFERIRHMVAHEIMSVLLDGSHDIFEVVTSPTSGARKDILRLRVSGAVHRHLTLAAKDRYGLTAH
ncbi:hypothetical protein [Aliiroseovarius sp. F47248L]|uniref:hypothetical protein n=1 Tax=Aliiroseovarius sp. F47248L TaxID=2926420 RepID=UPI001FF20021|nr:hypothetical protein [Aliiroseovarius sp. F47248L]MCK0139614.1 hypothetical protein [Aliiroseovarius sp. F47248L]